MPDTPAPAEPDPEARFQISEQEWVYLPVTTERPDDD